MQNCTSGKFNFSPFNKFLVPFLIFGFFHFSGVSQTYKENFEGRTADLDKAPWTLTGGSNNDKTVEGTDMGTGNATIVNDPSKSGNKVMKIDKKVPPAGERYDANSSREEIMYLGKAKDVPGAPPEFAPWFTPVTYRWRFYFTGNHDWDADENGPYTLGQWHHSQQVGAVPPPGTLRVRGNDLTYRARWSTSPNTTRATIKSREYTLKTNLKKNTWYYIVVDITWDYRQGKTGLIKAYLKAGGWPSKSNQVLDHSGSGVGVGYNHSVTGYAQVGGYFWPWREADGTNRSRAAGVKKFEFLIDDWEYTVGKHSFSGGASNKSPNANAGPDKSITLPKTNITLNGSGSDPDGSIDEYEWTQKSGPADATLKKEHTANLEASNLEEGVYVFRLTVTDDDGDSDSDDVLVTVEPGVNQSPTADAGSNTSITLPTDQITIEGSGSDPDGTIEEYSWRQTSGPSTATLSGKNTSDLTASDLVEGNYVFRLTVTDDDGDTDGDGIQVIVNPAPNQIPSANAGSNKTITLPTNQITIAGSGSDPDGTIDKYKWKQSSGPSTATLSGENSKDLTASDLEEGSYVFRLTVTDNDGLTDGDGVQVLVKSQPNIDPTADAGSNKTITLPNNKITINGSASDEDGTIATHSWSQTSGPSNATLTGKNSSKLTADNLTEGTYVFKLTITDDDGATDSDQMQVKVNAQVVTNQGPVSEAGPNKTITLPTNKVTVNGTGTDADGNVTSYSWSQSSGPSNATLTGKNSANLTAEQLMAGTYVFKLTITDNDGDTDSDEMRVTVKDPILDNQGPTAEAGPNKSLTLPDNSVILNGTGTDDGQISAYEWSQLSGPTNATMAQNSTSKLDLKDLEVGVYEFQLMITDDKGGTDTDEVHVTVFEALPSISANIDHASCTSSNGTISLNVSGGAGPFQYSWSNGSSTKDLANLNSGDYQVTLTDKNGNTLSKSFSVNSLVANLQLSTNLTNASCSNDNGSIEVTASGGAAPYSFEWSSPQARTSSLNQLAGGTYSLVVVDKNGCSKKFSFEVGIDPGETVHDVTSDIINASCAGNDGQISLDVAGSNGPYSYSWSNGATGPLVDALEDGKYTVTITDRNGCYMDLEYNINQDPGPAKPTITQSGDSLFVAQAASNYQWFRDSVAIASANSRSLKITEAGTYSVQIFSDKNCMASSDYFYALDPPPSSIIGNQLFTMQQVEIYPNPVMEDINVRLYVNEPAATNITIYDFQGRVMETHDLGVVHSQITENIRVVEFPSGTYLIRVTANQEILTRRFIKH